jgi:hypothetical protein
MSLVLTAPEHQHADLAEFRRTLQRQLAQRSDAPAPEALLHACALASRALLEQSWVDTQQADARRGRDTRRVHDRRFLERGARAFPR